MLQSDGAVGIPTEKRCEECGWRLVWSTKHQHYVHSYNTKVECPVLRKRDK